MFCDYYSMLGTTCHKYILKKEKEKFDIFRVQKNLEPKKRVIIFVKTKEKTKNIRIIRFAF